MHRSPLILSPSAPRQQWQLRSDNFDEWTGGGKRRVDRRWRETRLVVRKYIFTTLRDLYKNQPAKAKTAFYCQKIQESARDVKAMYRVTNNILGRKLPPTLPETSGARGFGRTFSCICLQQDCESPLLVESLWPASTVTANQCDPPPPSPLITVTLLHRHR